MEKLKNCVKCFSLLLLVFSLSFSMAGCDDDDETSGGSNELVGKWEGYSLWNEGSTLTIEFNSNGTLSGNESGDSFTGTYSIDTNLKTYSYKIWFGEDEDDTDEGHDIDYDIDGNTMQIRFDGEDWSLVRK